MERGFLPPALPRVTVCVHRASHAAAGWPMAAQTGHPPQCTWHLPANPWDSPASGLRGAALLRAEVWGNITTHVAATLKIPSLLMEGDDALVGPILHLPPAYTPSTGAHREPKGSWGRAPPHPGADRCRAELTREVCPRGAHQTSTGAAHSSIRIDFVVNSSQQESEMLLAETAMEDVPARLALHGDRPCPTDGTRPQGAEAGRRPLCWQPKPPLPSRSLCLVPGLCSSSPGRETEARGAWPHRSVDQQVLTAPEVGADAESKAGGGR